MDAKQQTSRARFAAGMLQIAGAGLCAGIIFEQGLSTFALYCVGVTTLFAVVSRIMFASER